MAGEVYHKLDMGPNNLTLLIHIITGLLAQWWTFFQQGKMCKPTAVQGYYCIGKSRSAKVASAKVAPAKVTSCSAKVSWQKLQVARQKSLGKS